MASGLGAVDFDRTTGPALQLTMLEYRRSKEPF